MSHSEEEKLRFKILNMLPTLNQSEGKVARLVLDYPDEIVNFSISQTAAQAGVRRNYGQSVLQKTYVKWLS